MSESFESKFFKAVASGVVTFFAIFGNLLVVAAVWLIPRMKTVTNYLIVNMAVADFLYILVVMPPFYIEIFELHKWAMGSYGRGVYFCKVVNFGQYFFASVSVLTLAAIAADRFFAIVLPLRRVFTKKAFYYIIPAIWMVATAVAAPIIYAYKFKELEVGFPFCDEDWSPAFENHKASLIYSVMLFVIVYCVPFLAITIMYTIICRRLWKRKILNNRHKRQYQKAIESRKKVVKMLITVVIAFVVCWLPVQVTTFIWETNEDITIPSSVYFVCMFLMRAHACTSPFVYAIFSENYRWGFKVALTSCCYGRKFRFRASPTLLRSTNMTMTSRRSFQLRAISRDETPDDEDDCENCEKTIMTSCLKTKW
jgi:G protein-coupled receptor 103